MSLSSIYFPIPPFFRPSTQPSPCRAQLPSCPLSFFSSWPHFFIKSLPQATPRPLFFHRCAETPITPSHYPLSSELLLRLQSPRDNCSDTCNRCRRVFLFTQFRRLTETMSRIRTMLYFALNLATWLDLHGVRTCRLPVLPPTDDFFPRPNPTSPYYLQIYLSFVLPYHPAFFRHLNPTPHRRTFIVPIIVPAGSGTSFVCTLLPIC